MLEVQLWHHLETSSPTQELFRVKYLSRSQNLVRPHKSSSKWFLGEIPSVETRTKGPVKLTPKFLQWKCAYCVLIAGLLHACYADSRSHFIKHATSLCCQGPRDSKWWMSAMKQQNKSNLKKQLVLRSVEWRLSFLPPLSSVVVLYTQGVECKQWREVRDRLRPSVPTTHFDQMSRVPIKSKDTANIVPVDSDFFCQRSTSLAAFSHWVLIRAGSRKLQVRMSLWDYYSPCNLPEKAQRGYPG